MQRTIPVYLAAICLLGGVWLSCSAPADEATKQTPKSARALEIVTPFTPGEMPTAEELLARCVKIFTDARSWTAEIELLAERIPSQADRSDSGTLVAKEQRLRADLFSDAADGRTSSVLIDEEQTVGWFKSRDSEIIRLREKSPGDGSGRHSANGTLRPFTILGSLTGSAQREAEVTKRYNLTHRGIAESDGAKFYVLELVLKDETAVKASEGGEQTERIAVAISSADALPRRIVCVSANGARRTLELGSFRFNVQIDSAQLVYTPPEGAIVVDRDTLDSPAKPLENPVAYTAESIGRGKSLYLADCVVCHSIDGTGRDSDVTDNAADLTSTEFWLSDGSDAATFLAIRDGAGEEMPGYKDDYRDEKLIWDLVNYIRSLQSNE